jgi:hypothetical protein
LNERQLSKLKVVGHTPERSFMLIASSRVGQPEKQSHLIQVGEMKAVIEGVSVQVNTDPRGSAADESSQHRAEPPVLTQVTNTDLKSQH